MRLLALLGLASAIGCAGDPIPLRDCTPGATLPCACVGGTAGAQVCTADAHLGACVCPDASTPVDALEGDAGPDGAVDVLQVADAADAADAGVDVVDAVDAFSADAPPSDVADVQTCDRAPADPMNCGACGRACPARANASSTCSGSACSFLCLRGFGNCDSDPANGCEVDTRFDPMNCGTCGRRCSSSHGTATCVDFTCGIVCESGWCDADGMAANGCETRC